MLKRCASIYNRPQTLLLQIIPVCEGFRNSHAEFQINRNVQMYQMPQWGLYFYAAHNRLPPQRGSGFGYVRLGSKFYSVVILPDFQVFWKIGLSSMPPNTLERIQARGYHRFNQNLTTNLRPFNTTALRCA